MTAAAVRWAAREVIEPAVIIGEFATVRDVEHLVSRRAHPFLSHAGQWRTFDVLELVGVPPSRRVIEAGPVVVEALGPDVRVNEDDFATDVRPVVDRSGVLLGAASRAKVRRLRERNDALTEVRSALRMMAHDGNNALALANMALECDDREQIRAALERLRRIFGGAEELVTGVPKVEVCDVGALMRRVAITSTQLTGVEVIASDVRAVFVRCSLYRLERALFNLVMNAGRAEARRVQLGCALAGEHASIQVRDDGVGIEASRLPRVLERGYSSTGGQGLGLPHVRDFVRRYGGGFAIDSVLGAGTVVTLTLPRG